MAQRTIHYLMGELLLNDKIRNKNRFRIGNLLPDAYGENVPRSLSHYTKKLPQQDVILKYCDFEAFRRQFAHEIETDDLYLGYYLHLIEDACFRIFWMKLGLAGQIKSQEDVALLHRDYHILNAYIVHHYGICNEITPIAHFETEQIHQITPFLLEQFLAEFEKDFSDNTQGETTFLTVDKLDMMVKDYLGICADAMRRIQQRQEPLNPLALSWQGVE